MSTPADVKLTIAFTGPPLDEEVQDRDALRLIAEMKDLDGVNTVSRGNAGEPVPELSKGVGSFVVGLLTAEINAESAKSVLRFLRDRLQGKSIALKVEANGNRIELSVNDVEELNAAIEAAQRLILQPGQVDSDQANSGSIK